MVTEDRRQGVCQLASDRAQGLDPTPQEDLVDPTQRTGYLVPGDRPIPGRQGRKKARAEAAGSKRESSGLAESMTDQSFGVSAG